MISRGEFVLFGSPLRRLNQEITAMSLTGAEGRGISRRKGSTFHRASKELNATFDRGAAADFNSAPALETILPNEPGADSEMVSPKGLISNLLVDVMPPNEPRHWG